MERRKHKLTRRLGLGSYRGRYLWLAALLSAALLVAAYFGQVLVRENTERSTTAATRQALLVATLDEASHRLHNLKVQLGSFSLDPTRTDASLVTAACEQAEQGVENLAAELKQMAPANQEGIAGELVEDSKLLGKHTARLIELRQSTPQWIPGSLILTESMIPANLAFKSHVQNLESMLDDSPDDRLLRIILLDLHNNWLGVIGETRLMVANRFGTFDADALAGMQSRQTNTENYIARTRQLISRLATAIAEHGDEFMLQEQAGIQQAFNSWINSLQTLRVLLDREDWRRDTPFLHNKMDPVLERLQQRITRLRHQIQDEAQRQLDNVLDNSASLASAISAVALGVISFFLVGYAAFDRWLLRPMQDIADQLKREAQGANPKPLVTPPVEEARTLVEAFDEMHQQVRARQQRLDHMAHHDALTGLPNRVMFRERLNANLRNELSEGEHIALLFLDLDRFKQINDSHGHLVGDQLLVQVARRLRSVFRNEDTVARLSGDEFAVLLHSFSDRNELSHLAQKVVSALKPPFEIDGHTYHSSASIGLTMAPQDGSDADQLIQHADAAMYHAKSAGRSGYCHFTQDMVEQSSAQLALENELHEAVLKQELEIYLQPVVDLDTLEVHAHECLLRWHHPQRGLLTPDEFLATLEDMALLQSITDCTLDQLAESGATDGQTVSINLPAKLLHQEDFAQSLESRLRDGRLNPRHLIVEITEDSFSADLAGAAQRLRRLQQLGVRIALDDFGTGQSSLSHLRAFPFDMLKIDRSFVRDIIDDEQDATLVRAIIVLARTLGIEVVGEGVENQQQRKFLQHEGCHYGQGYLFGTPDRMTHRPA